MGTPCESEPAKGSSSSERRPRLRACPHPRLSERTFQSVLKSGSTRASGSGPEVARHCKHAGKPPPLSADGTRLPSSLLVLTSLSASLVGESPQPGAQGSPAFWARLAPPAPQLQASLAQFSHNKSTVLLSSPQGVFDPTWAPSQKVTRRRHSQGEGKTALLTGQS